MSVVIPSLRAAIAVPPWVKNELWRRARAVPSLDLRFADNKSLVDAVTGASLITFTRASSGTYTDSAGVIQTAAADVPRFDHDPITGESLGLLVEEQRTNLLLRSEDFSTTWTRTNVAAFGSGSAVDVETAPNGTLTADLISILSGNNSGTGFIGQTITKSATATTYTITVFAKAQNWNTVTLQVNDAATNNNRASVTFSLATGAITTAAAVFGTFSAVSATPASSFADGWFKANLTFTSSTETGLLVRIFPNNSSTVTADGTSGIYLWGADLQAGASPTSYIPATTAAVTRSASLSDLISGAIANNIRSFYVEFSSPAVGTRGVVSLNDNTASERASVLTSGTDPRLVVQDGGVEQANINGGTVAANVRTRVAVRINANDFAISINGGAVVTDTSGTLPTVDRLMFGRTQAGEYLNGRIARFTGWSQLLPNATLQTLAQ